MEAFALALLVLGAGPAALTPRHSGLARSEASAMPDPPARGGTDAGRRGEPYRRSSPDPRDFRGAGREQPEPEVDEVVLGWFGPGDPAHPEFGEYWRGAVVALEEENAAGGYRGKPFRLEPAWSENPWRAGVVDVARLVSERSAWAVVGGVDGTTTHLAAQLALKSHFLLLSPGSTDVTADGASVPWLFSLPPSDEAIARVLADAVAAEEGGARFAIAAATDHDSHASLAALRRALGDRRMNPAALVELPTGDADVASVVGKLLEPRPRVLVVVARAGLAGRLVAAVRATGFAGRVVGGPSCSGRAFARAAVASADGVVAPLLAAPDARAPRLDSAYEAQWHDRPGEAARLGYDGVRLVAAAVRQAGLNRARIRDAVRALVSWKGASGTVDWDPRGRNRRGVVLGHWRSGHLVPIARATGGGRRL